MKYYVTLFFIYLSLNSFSQDSTIINKRDKKGKFYVNWGWNRAYYSPSNITFKGNNYDFTLKKMVAEDRPSPLSLNTYLNPIWATIPQYNFRVGYYFKSNYDISFGIDHMKYIMVADQFVQIYGYINEGGVYDGEFEGEQTKLHPDFLKFEHTDGLNYANFEIRRTDEFYRYKKFTFSIITGIGSGIIYPRTNTYLMDYVRYDKFNLAGYGLAAVLAPRASYKDQYYIQFEYKGGYINMPNIRTTHSKDDSANQSFHFSQFNMSLGVIIGANKK